MINHESFVRKSFFLAQRITEGRQGLFMTKPCKWHHLTPVFLRKEGAMWCSCCGEGWSSSHRQQVLLIKEGRLQ